MIPKDDKKEEIRNFEVYFSFEDGREKHEEFLGFQDWYISTNTWIVFHNGEGHQNSLYRRIPANLEFFRVRVIGDEV